MSSVVLTNTFMCNVNLIPTTSKPHCFRLHEFPHIFGGVSTAIVSKVFDVVGKLLQCQFNDALTKVWFYVIFAGICFILVHTYLPCHPQIFSGPSQIQAQHALALELDIVCFLVF